MSKKLSLKITQLVFITIAIVLSIVLIHLGGLENFVLLFLIVASSIAAIYTISAAEKEGQNSNTKNTKK